MDKTIADTFPAPLTPKQRIAAIARTLARNAPNADAESFYLAIAEEFERQIESDQKRAAAVVPNLASKTTDAK